MSIFRDPHHGAVVWRPVASFIVALAVVSACASTGTTGSIGATTSPTAGTVGSSPSGALAATAAPPTPQPPTSVPASLLASPPIASTAAPVGPDYRIDATVDWIHFTAQKCGSPSGTWDLAVDGVRDLGGGQLVLSGAGTVVLDAATLTGPWEAQYRIDLTGVPAAIGGQEAGLTGQASLAGTTLSIYSQVGTGDFWAQTPALALGGPADDPRKDFQLPVQSGQFC